MEVVLLEDVKTLGKKGQIVKVNDGYARNYILPKKLGVEATPKNLNDLKLQKANAERIAAEQLAAAKELAARIAEISDQAKGTAQGALEARNQTHLAGQEVSACNQQMQELMEAMGRIQHSSDEIGKIIKTIEDIAFQTNILALNAAVEAARAGSAGKGFAVVADEVRNLASKSAEASKSTSALIEHSSQAVNRGTDIARHTAETLMEVVNSMDSVVSSIDRIATVSNEQSYAVAQVTEGINQISGVVQSNSATAEESAAASEQLSAEAVGLKKLVDKFTLARN